MMVLYNKKNQKGQNTNIKSYKKLDPYLYVNKDSIHTVTKLYDL